MSTRMHCKRAFNTQHSRAEAACTCGDHAGDGAASATRRQLGISWEGTSDLQHLINIHFRSAELARHLRKAPGMLYFVFSSRAIVVLVAHDLRIGVLLLAVQLC